MASCEDIVTQLDRIATAIEAQAGGGGTYDLLTQAVLGITSEINIQGAGLNEKLSTANTHLLNLAPMAEAVEDSADSLEGLRTVHETAMGALNVALNSLLGAVDDDLQSIALRLSPSDINNIWDAILALIPYLALVPIVNVGAPVITVTCGDAYGGTDRPTEPWHPPETWPAIDPPDDPRKCKAANLIMDGLISVSEEFDDANVVTWTALGLTLIGLALAQILAGTALFAGAAKVWKVIVGLVDILLAGNVDFNHCVNAFNGNRTDFVCSMYEANDEAAAVTAWDAVAETAGLTDEERAFFVLLFNSVATMGLLFNEVTNDGAWPYVALSEDNVTNYDMTGKPDCSSCEEPTGCDSWISQMIEPHYTFDAFYSTIVSVTETSTESAEITIQSAYRAAEDHELCGFRLKQEFVDLGCSLWLTNYTHISGTADSSGSLHYIAPGGQDTYTSFPNANLPPVPKNIKASYAGHALTISPGQFTAKFTVQKTQPV